MKVELKIRITKTCIKSESKRQMNLILNYVLKVVPNAEIESINEKGFIISNSDIDLTKVFHYKYITIIKSDDSYYLEINEKALSTAFSMVDLKYQPDRFVENMKEISRYKKACNGKILKGYFTKEEDNRLKKNRHLDKKSDNSQKKYNELRQKGIVKKAKLNPNPIKVNGFINESHKFKSNVNTVVLTRSGAFKPIK